MPGAPTLQELDFATVDSWLQQLTRLFSMKIKVKRDQEFHNVPRLRDFTGFFV